MSSLQMSPLAPCPRAESITYQNTMSPECPHSPVHVHTENTGKDEHIKKHTMSILKSVKSVLRSRTLKKKFCDKAYLTIMLISWSNSPTLYIENNYSIGTKEEQEVYP